MLVQLNFQKIGTLSSHDLKVQIHGSFRDIERTDVLDNHFVLRKTFDFEKQSRHNGSTTITLLHRSVDLGQGINGYLRIVDQLAILIDLSRHISVDLLPGADTT